MEGVFFVKSWENICFSEMWNLLDDFLTWQPSLPFSCQCSDIAVSLPNKSLYHFHYMKTVFVMQLTYIGSQNTQRFITCICHEYFWGFFFWLNTRTFRFLRWFCVKSFKILHLIPESIANGTVMLSILHSIS